MNLPPYHMLRDKPGGRTWTLPDLLIETGQLRADRQEMQECIRKLARYVPINPMNPNPHNQAIITEAVHLQDKPHELNRMSNLDVISAVVQSVVWYIEQQGGTITPPPTP